MKVRLPWPYRPPALCLTPKTPRYELTVSKFLPVFAIFRRIDQLRGAEHFMLLSNDLVTAVAKQDQERVVRIGYASVGCEFDTRHRSRNGINERFLARNFTALELRLLFQS